MSTHRNSRSKASLRREARRTCPETQQFREKVETFLQTANTAPDLVYLVKTDLSRKTDQPYYKKPKLRPSKPRPRQTLILELLSLLRQYNDPELTRQLLPALGRHQNSALRKLAPKIATTRRTDCVCKWEHAIPTAYFIKELCIWVTSKEEYDIGPLLRIYTLAGQRSLPDTANEIIKAFGYSSCMPPDWDWRVAGADYLARYRAVGIMHLVPRSEGEY